MSNIEGSNLLGQLAISAQRLNIRLPGALRSALGRWLRRAMLGRGGRAAVADWSTPLIARAGRVPAPVHALAPPGQPAAAVPQATRPAPAAGPGRVRCLLATSDLDAGGMDEVVAFLARCLPRFGVTTAVLHASPTGSPDGRPRGRLGRALLAQGVEVKELSAADGAAWMAQWRPEVISAHGAPAWVLEAAQRQSVPYVDTLHGMHSLFHVDWAAEARRSLNLARIVSVSELVRQQYLRGNPGFAAERIVTIPNGVDGERRQLPDRGAARAGLGLEREFLFVSLARHCLQKNTYGLVAAFAEVAAQHPEAHLVIAGRPDDPTYFAQVARLRAKLPCRERIHLRDHTPDPALLLAAADGFVLDSFFEGWPLASMEALYAGVPVVISEVGGAREQLGEDGSRGVLVPNPLGDPLRVDWNTIRAARFERQANRDALVAAMGALVRERAHWDAARTPLRTEAARRFAAEPCLQAHAELLAAVASRQTCGSTP